MIRQKNNPALVVSFDDENTDLQTAIYLIKIQPSFILAYFHNQLLTLHKELGQNNINNRFLFMLGMK